MGLDMYLSAKKYLYENPKDEDGVKVSNVAGAGKMRLKELTYEAMYWRKANQIHQWFVDNVQGGADNCGEYPVSRQQLEDLVQDCKTVIDDPARASEVLPSTPGFFFGATEYDDWYKQNVQETHDKLLELLDRPMGHEWSFSYQSSW